MPTVFMITKNRMTAIVKAAYYIYNIKKIDLSLGSVEVNLRKIQESIDSIEKLRDKLMVRRLTLELFLSKQIELILNAEGHTMAYPITNLTKEQLEMGYINLSSGMDNYVGDYIFNLIDGSIYTLREGHQPTQMNALIYHGITKEKLTP
jgi:hypothetical protein